MEDYAFIATRVGDKNSPERRRADEVTDFIIKPVLDEFSLTLVRADRDPTPGQITPQILRSLLEARVVIADLTGKNPNVYYELAVAHSFSKAVIPLVDKAENVAFDTKDERLIQLGEYAGALTVTQAEETKPQLRQALKVVMNDAFIPSSLVAEVATARSIDELAPDNPMASEIAAIRESLDEIRNLVARPRRIVPANLQAESRAMRKLLEDTVGTGHLTAQHIRDVDLAETSTKFDEWLQNLNERIEDPWATPRVSGGWGSNPADAEEPPF
jgi:hypothetical protein